MQTALCLDQTQHPSAAPLCNTILGQTMEQTPHINMGPMGWTTEEKVKITVLRGHTQFSVEVDTAQIKNTQFGKDLLRQIKLYQGRPLRNYGSFDLVYQHCLPLFEKLAPQTSLQDLTLECFLHSPTYHLEFADAGTDGSIRIEGEDRCVYTPSFAISPMRTIDLPVFCDAIPHFRACRTLIDPTTRDKEKSLDTIQGKVITADGTAMYFKPRIDMREPEFERELHIMSRIEEAGLNGRIRVPKLKGIVVAGENGESTMGMLMTMITSPEMGIHLQSQGFHGQPELHKKWEEQVTAIVHELHANGIVWGDVNPMNVVIDEAMDAWVIDFGGMNNVEFVDEENRETIEGDKQGIMRLFREWLPSRYKLYMEDQYARETPSSHS
jgi:tRNA A-37 threonylcarbamoyl transferase component Bud32